MRFGLASRIQGCFPRAFTTVIAGNTLIDLGKGLEIPASWLPEGVTPTASPPAARLSNERSPDPF